jgi:hypothetical protein
MAFEAKPRWTEEILQVHSGEQPQPGRKRAETRPGESQFGWEPEWSVLLGPGNFRWEEIEIIEVSSWEIFEMDDL